MGKSEVYIKKPITELTCNTNNMNMTIEQWFELNTIFNEIRNVNKMDDALNKLNIFQRNNENVNINEILDAYIKMCDII